MMKLNNKYYSLSNFILNKSSKYIHEFKKTYSLYFNIKYENIDLNIEISEENLKILNEITQKNLIGEDTTFLINKRRFYNITLELEIGVFVPQWDSEGLIDQVLEYNKINNFTKGLEIGLGTGALSLSISKNSNIFMEGIDVNSQAVELSKKNAIINNIKNIFFKKEDLFTLHPKEKYNFLISNPPYIDKNIEKVEKWVYKNQPHNALFTNEHNLEFYEYLLKNSNKFLQSKGFYFLEINPLYQINLEILIKSISKIKTYIFKKDLNNKIRYLIVKF